MLVYTDGAPVLPVRTDKNMSFHQLNIRHACGKKKKKRKKEEEKSVTNGGVLRKEETVWR